MKQPSPDLRICVVDDHEVIRRGLRDLFSTQDDIVVGFEAGSAEEALALMERDPPDVAVLDVRLPDMDGVTLCREIRARHPEVKCLMFSSFSSEAAMLEAVIAGASGFILKDAEMTDFLGAVRDVARGRSLIDPAMTQRVIERIRERPVESGLADLTPQEQKVLDLMAEGQSNREISENLYLAEQTVKNYVSNVLSKLGMQRRTQAVRFALDSQRRTTEAESDAR